MPIAALPPTTTHPLTSTQVLTTPLSAVKELLENSLDARATSISVEISTDTVTAIQVRDNGHGVPPDDRRLLCVRYATSKIRGLEDLKAVGGRWLGFRGEALASCVELCESVKVVTRVEGEEVARELGFTRGGDLESEQTVSAPVGTTVKLSKLFDSVPVRKEFALKTAAKCLLDIKRLMKAYALARPAIRLSLRVLKAKNDKGNFVYAPQPGATIEAAAYKVVGSECASQSAMTVLERDGLEVQAFLPRHDADGEKVSGRDQFVSVDARPVTSNRGIMKDVIKSFKTRLKKVASNDVKDPFICINFICTAGSYDPNVEPAKDDVLFEDSNKVHTAFEALLDAVYPLCDEKAIDPTIRTDGLLRKRHFSVFQDKEEKEEEACDEREQKPKKLWVNNLYDAEEDATPLLQDPIPSNDPEDDPELEAKELRNISVSNPWIMAKINATMTPRKQPFTPLMASDVGVARRATPKSTVSPWTHAVSRDNPLSSSPQLPLLGPSKSDPSLATPPASDQAIPNNANGVNRPLSDDRAFQTPRPIGIHYPFGGLPTPMTSEQGTTPYMRPEVRKGRPAGQTKTRPALVQEDTPSVHDPRVTWFSSPPSQSRYQSPHHSNKRSDRDIRGMLSTPEAASQDMRESEGRVAARTRGMVVRPQMETATSSSGPCLTVPTSDGFVRASDLPDLGSSSQDALSLPVGPKRTRSQQSAGGRRKRTSSSMGDTAFDPEIPVIRAPRQDGPVSMVKPQPPVSVQKEQGHAASRTLFVTKSLKLPLERVSRSQNVVFRVATSMKGLARISSGKLICKDAPRFREPHQWLPDAFVAMQDACEVMRLRHRLEHYLRRTYPQHSLLADISEPD